MITILTKYFTFKIIYFGILIAGYIYYKKSSVSLLIVSIISFLTIAALINDFYAPSLSSNIKVYNKIKNLDVDELESINIITNGIEKTVSSEEQLKLFVEYVKQTDVYKINNPKYIQELELNLNFKQTDEMTKLIVIELGTDESIIEMMNNFNNHYYKIAEFENPNMHKWINTALKN
ncbi:MAG: hypothetical protein ACI83H_001267 [Glaciecola sp.]|jgi:hypothetical protein